jgi:hypothetical protein
MLIIEIALGILLGGLLLMFWWMNPPSNRVDKSEHHREKIAARIYSETALFYAEIKPQLNGTANGYKVLYGPPLRRPPIFFLGLQVGGVARAERGNEQESWPVVTEYAVANWALARKLRDNYDVEFLKTCTGTNINFFRARNDAIYRADVPANLRERCETFSRDRAEQLLKTINPYKIVVIGFDVLKKLKVDRQFVCTEAGVKRGDLWGYPTLAVWHLTGMRMTNEQREVIRRALRSFAGMR